MQMTGSLDGAVEDAGPQHETPDTELASTQGSIPGLIPGPIPGLIHIPGAQACAQTSTAAGGLDAIQLEGSKATDTVEDGRVNVATEAAAEAAAEVGAEAKKSGSTAGADLPAGDEGAEVRAPGGQSTSLSAQAFDMARPEPSHERQTVLTQSSQERMAAPMDSDTLRFTYHFRSWQGQPSVAISLNFHEQSRKLRVEAPDRAVFTALLANRDTLPGVVKIVDNEPDSGGREGRQWEQGE